MQMLGIWLSIVALLSFKPTDVHAVGECHQANFLGYGAENMCNDCCGAGVNCKWGTLLRETGNGCGLGWLYDGYECCKRDDGDSCSEDKSCTSNKCEERCCGPKGRSTGCTNCDGWGNCNSCVNGYVLINSECRRANQPDGNVCFGSTECSSNSCKGNNCCNSNGRGAGCTGCDRWTGDCNQVSSDYYLNGGSGLPILKKIDGATCSSTGQCRSNSCKGYNCCNSGVGRDASCSSCDSDGNCDACKSGHYLSPEGKCLAQKSNGDTCDESDSVSLTSSCSSGVCKGNNCCGPAGQEGCDDCASDGTCSTCSSGYTKYDNECVSGTPQCGRYELTAETCDPKFVGWGWIGSCEADGTWCDTEFEQNLCRYTKCEVGEACTADRHCASGGCVDGICRTTTTSTTTTTTTSTTTTTTTATTTTTTVTTTTLTPEEMLAKFRVEAYAAFAEKDATIAHEKNISAVALAAAAKKNAALAQEKNISAAALAAVAEMNSTIAEITAELGTCTIDLEARRLVRLAEAAEDLDKFNAHDQAGDVDVGEDPGETASSIVEAAASSMGDGAIGGIVVGVLVFIAIAFFLFRWCNEEVPDDEPPSRRTKEVLSFENPMYEDTPNGNAAVHEEGNGSDSSDDHDGLVSVRDGDDHVLQLVDSWGESGGHGDGYLEVSDAGAGAGAGDNMPIYDAASATAHSNTAGAGAGDNMPIYDAASATVHLNNGDHGLYDAGNDRQSDSGSDGDIDL